MTLPVVEGFAEGKQGFGTSVTVTKPTGTADTDLLVLFVAALSNANTWVLPSGFTQMDNVSNANTEFLSAYKVAGASEPASYTTSWTTNSQVYSHIVRISGIDTGATIPDVGGTATGTATAMVSPDVTTVTNDCVLLRCGSTNSNTNIDTGYDGATNGLTCDSATGTVRVGWSAWEDQATAGATGTTTQTGSTSNEYVAATYAFAGPGAGGPSVALLRRRGRG